MLWTTEPRFATEEALSGCIHFLDILIDGSVKLGSSKNKKKKKKKKKKMAYSVHELRRQIGSEFVFLLFPHSKRQECIIKRGLSSTVSLCDWARTLNPSAMLTPPTSFSNFLRILGPPPPSDVNSTWHVWVRGMLTDRINTWIKHNDVRFKLKLFRPTL